MEKQQNTMPESLKIKDDSERGVVEIEGIEFSYEFFRFFGKESNKGKKFQITEHKDGVITITTLED